MLQTNQHKYEYEVLIRGTVMKVSTPQAALDVTVNLEILTLTSSASDSSLLALLLSSSDCLSERTSIAGLLEFSSMNVLQSV